MGNLKFEIDASSIASLGQELNEILQQKVDLAVGALAASTHARVTELAQENLHSTRNKYLDNLGFQEISKGVWVVSLKQPAMFIEEGMEAHSMIDDLLKNGARVSKSGNRYKAIPFSHSDIPQNMTPKAMEFRQILKAELKARNIPFKKIETHGDGTPRLGLLHSLDIDSPRPSTAASHPVFSGLNIYQNKTTRGNVRRDIVTFRMVSDKQKFEKWNHPGLSPKHFFEKAFQEAKTEWETQILPELLQD